MVTKISLTVTGSFPVSNSLPLIVVGIPHAVTILSQKSQEGLMMSQGKKKKRNGELRLDSRIERSLEEVLMGSSNLSPEISGQSQERRGFGYQHFSNSPKMI